MKLALTRREIEEKIPWLRLASGSKVVPHFGAWYKVLFGEVDGAKRMMVRMQKYVSEGWTGEHFHANEEQLFYILEGEAAFKVEGEEYRGGPGMTVFVPTHAIHSYKPLSKEGFTFLFIRAFLGEYGYGGHNVKEEKDRLEPKVPLDERLSRPFKIIPDPRFPDSGELIGYE